MKKKEEDLIMDQRWIAILIIAAVAAVALIAIATTGTWPEFRGSLIEQLKMGPSWL